MIYRQVFRNNGKLIKYVEADSQPPDTLNGTFILTDNIYLSTEKIDERTIQIVKSLEDFRKEKKAELKAGRDAEELAGFMYKNKQFNSDEVSIRRLNTAISSGICASLLNADFSVDWTCADDTSIALTKDDFVTLPLVMAQFGNAIHIKYRDKKAQLFAANSIEEVQSIVWEGK